MGARWAAILGGITSEVVLEAPLCRMEMDSAPERCFQILQVSREERSERLREGRREVGRVAVDEHVSHDGQAGFVVTEHWDRDCR